MTKKEQAERDRFELRLILYVHGRYPAPPYVKELRALYNAVRADYAKSFTRADRAAGLTPDHLMPPLRHAHLYK